MENDDFELVYSYDDDYEDDDDDWYDPDVCGSCGSHRCLTCGEMTCFGCSCDEDDEDDEEYDEYYDDEEGLEEFEYMCQDCGYEFHTPSVFEEEVFEYEYWGDKGTKKELVARCPNCNSDNIEENSW